MQELRRRSKQSELLGNDKTKKEREQTNKNKTKTNKQIQRDKF